MNETTYEVGDRVCYVGHHMLGTVKDVGDGSVIGVAWDDMPHELGFEDPLDLELFV